MPGLTEWAAGLDCSELYCMTEQYKFGYRLIGWDFSKQKARLPLYIMISCTYIFCSAQAGLTVVNAACMRPTQSSGLLRNACVSAERSAWGSDGPC